MSTIKDTEKFNTVKKQEAINERTYTEPIDSRSRFLGFSLMLTQIGTMIGYGLAGVFKGQTYGFNLLRTEILYLILMFIFITMGFGMLTNIYRFGNWLGACGALITLAVCIQLSPLLQKLWISITITSFGGANLNVTDSTATLYQYWPFFSNSQIDSNYVSMRTTLLSVISIMTVMTSVVGRVGLMQIVKLASMFQIAWCANYYLLIYFLGVRNLHGRATYNPFFYDMFGTTYVYVFAVFFALPFSCFLMNQKLPEVHPRNQFNRLSLLLCQIGTAFLLGAFVFSSCYVIDYNIYYNALGNNYARFSIFFGIIGCVIGTFIGSALVGRGRVGYKEVLVSTVAGGIVMGSAAPIVYNIGILIMIGGVTGFFSGIYMRAIHVKINKRFVKDTLGVFGPFCISSIFGSLIVTPAVLATYYNRGINFPLTSESVPLTLAGYQLIYLGISAAIGLLGGLVTSLFSFCDKDYFALASNSRIFLNDFGLFDYGEIAKSQQVLPPPSATKIPSDPNQLFIGQNSNQGLNKSANLL